jgi:hypothetical protein
MEITNTVSYKLSFVVAYHEGTEGGMDYEEFGKEYKDIKEALRLWETAKDSRPGHDWQIVCNVQRIVK